MDNDVELEYKLRLALAEVASAHASVETGLNELQLLDARAKRMDEDVRSKQEQLLHALDEQQGRRAHREELGKLAEELRASPDRLKSAIHRERIAGLLDHQVDAYIGRLQQLHKDRQQRPPPVLVARISNGVSVAPALSVLVLANYTMQELRRDAMRCWGLSEELDSPERRLVVMDAGGVTWPPDARVADALRSSPTSCRFCVELCLAAIQHVPVATLDPYTPEQAVSVRAFAAGQRDGTSLQLAGGAPRTPQDRVFAFDRIIDTRKKLCVDMLVGFVALVIFIAVQFLRRDVHYIYSWVQAGQQQLLRTQFGSNRATFATMQDPLDYYQWVAGPLYQFTHGERHTDGGIVLEGRRAGLTWHYHVPMGPVRLRQYRVARSPCPGSLSGFDPDKGGLFKECFLAYTTARGDRGPYSNSTAHIPGFIFHPGNTTLDLPPSTQGEFATYSGPGYPVDLPQLAPDVWNATLRALKEHHWIDARTRAIISTFALYNPNADEVTFYKQMYELSPTGSTATRSSTSVMPLSAYSTPFQKFIGMLEVLHYFFLGYLVWLTWRYIAVYSEDYKTSDSVWQRVRATAQTLAKMVWPVQDLAVVVLGLVSGAIKLAYFLDADRRSEAFGGQYVDLESNASRIAASFVLDSFTNVLLVLRHFKFVEVNARLYIIRTSIIRGMGELIFAMALFAAFSYGFVIVALETYGPSLQQFSTLSWAQTSVLLLQTGVIPYDEMEEANPWFTPLFFILYMLVIIFALRNLFVSIMTVMYSVVNHTESCESMLTMEDVGEIVFPGPSKLKTWVAACFKSQRPA